MSRTRTRKSWWWIGFLILWMIALGAVILLSASLIRLDRSEREARLDAAIEENLRLALWRLDSVLAPLVAQQALVPVNSIIDEAERSELSNTTFGQGTARLPVITSFQWLEEDAETVTLQGIEHPLEEIRQSIALLPKVPQPIPRTIDPGSEMEGESMLTQQNRIRAANEFNQRAQNFEFGNQVLRSNSVVATSGSTTEPWTVVWHQGQLLMLRDSQTIGFGSNVGRGLEGWLLDWERLKSFMQKSIEDLLPQADFLPMEDQKARSPDSLVSIPCVVQPGTVARGFLENVDDGRWPIPWILGLMWSVFLLTSLASGLALASAQRWSDRREAFVAAVTHELRTPLTTLQLVSEMLGNGMIQDEGSRKSYLETLQSEVQRIGHLVENVFAYARLERGRAPRDIAPSSLREMLDRMEPKLTRIAERSEMVLDISPSEAWDSMVVADASMLEQILVNLVDNASKYAKHAGDRSIHL
nr:HAMP domain-containing histidine kinase [Pirellula sp.]